MIVKGYFKDETGELARKRARKLKELQKRKLLEFKEMPDGSIKINLSHLGKNLIRQYKLEEITIIKPKQWDKKWRIITYDIPHSQQRASQALSKKLRELQLYQLQKSIWVSPYECLGEIEFICTVFDINIGNCIRYFRTSEIPKEKEIKDFFNL